MSVQNAAEHFDRLFSKLESNRRQLIEDAEEVCVKADEELALIKEVMAKHNLPFKNQLVSAESFAGIVVGEKNGAPLVLRYGYVFADMGNGEIDAESKQSLRQFLSTADLSVIKSGFEYVRKMRCAEDNSIVERNKQLKQFMSDIKDFNLNSLIT